MKIAIYGSGVLGVYCYKLIMNLFNTDYKILGFIDDFRKPGEKVIGDDTILGNIDDLQQFSPDEVKLVLAIGYENLAARYSCYKGCKEKGFSFINLIHPDVIRYADLTIGEGNIILAGSVIDQNINIGNANYIDMGCIFSHDASIGDNNFFALGFNSAGFIKIGNSNFIGMKTAVTDHLTIGDNNYICSGSLITADLGNARKVYTIYQQMTLDRD